MDLLWTLWEDFLEEVWENSDATRQFSLDETEAHAKEREAR